MPALFATTLFLSAILLFVVQPMIAKMVLPVLGGTPAVWNTCLVFFQASLLAGYAYSHFISSRLSLPKQFAAHLTLLLGASLALPITLAHWTLGFLPKESNPSIWLLFCLAMTVGLPFVAVSTNGPLLQRWFSYLPHRSAHDPYFLYAASNVGSLTALLAYPFLVEPRFRLGAQSRLWMIGFFLLVGLIATCGLCALKMGRIESPDPLNGQLRSSQESPLSTGSSRRWRWLILSFVPSSLMLGVTTYLTTDIASIPALWVLPLSIYLLTFVIAFARTRIIQAPFVRSALPLGVIGLVYLLLTEATQPVGLIIAIHLIVFFFAAMTCHGQLAEERPPADKLTEFYLWISAGGVLGGIFNALVAPVLFDRITEYPLAILAACCLCPAAKRTPPVLKLGWKSVATASAIGLFAVLLARWVPHWRQVPTQLRLGTIFGLPLLLCYTTVDRPFRFALALSAVFAASSIGTSAHGKPLYLERNFFGALRITLDPIGPFYRLVHGNTIHGREAIDLSRCCEPLSYYHRSGPVGQIMAVFKSLPISKTVGIVGLGAGSMACYAAPTEDWTFYEINPAVVRIARDTPYFSFLRNSPNDHIKLVLGDARLQLQNATPGQYGLLVLDAFSSDAIPLHLMTREALALYLSKLAPGGILAFHISNRYLDLEGVLADLAHDAKLVCRAHDEMDLRAGEEAEGKDPSHWFVMARQRKDLGNLARDSRWVLASHHFNPQVWTDDFCNLLGVFRWD